MPLTVSDAEKQELLCTLAALILHDDKAPITGENIQKLITASGANVEPYWPKLFASLLDGKDLGSMLLSASAAPAPGAGGAAPAAAAGGAADKKKEEEKPKKEEKPKEESGGDMGFSLFD